MDAEVRHVEKRMSTTEVIVLACESILRNLEKNDDKDFLLHNATFVLVFFLSIGHNKNFMLSAMCSFSARVFRFTATKHRSSVN